MKCFNKLLCDFQKNKINEKFRAKKFIKFLSEDVEINKLRVCTVQMAWEFMAMDVQMVKILSTHRCPQNNALSPTIKPQKLKLVSHLPSSFPSRVRLTVSINVTANFIIRVRTRPHWYWFRAKWASWYLIILKIENKS